MHTATDREQHSSLNLTVSNPFPLEKWNHEAKTIFSTCKNIYKPTFCNYYALPTGFRHPPIIKPPNNCHQKHYYHLISYSFSSSSSAWFSCPNQKETETSDKGFQPARHGLKTIHEMGTWQKKGVKSRSLKVRILRGSLSFSIQSNSSLLHSSFSLPQG